MAVPVKERQLERHSTSRDDCDFVCGVVPSQFICTICSHVLQKPHLTECCGQHYCDICLSTWLSNNRPTRCCPQCREKHVTHIHDKSLERQINELQVRCKNKEKGCKWMGELGDLKYHLSSDSGCTYEEVKCSHSNCTVKTERRFFADHIDKCLFRPYTCKFCGLKDTYQAIHDHYEECENFPISCPKGCGETIVRKNLKSHRSTCQMQVVACPYMKTGCKRNILRKDVHAHLEENIQQHMVGMLQSHQVLATKCAELEEKNLALATKYVEWDEKNRKLKNNISQLEIRVEDLEDELYY